MLGDKHMIKELSLAEKKKLCMLSDSQTIYYMIDNKIVTPTPQFSCPSYDEFTSDYTL